MVLCLLYYLIDWSIILPLQSPPLTFSLSLLGVLRGTGKQFVGAVANVIAFYAIGSFSCLCRCYCIDVLFLSTLLRTEPTLYCKLQSTYPRTSHLT